MHWLPLGGFSAALSVFHVSEFCFAAVYMRDELSLHSWLLSLPYLMAMVCGILEYVVEDYFQPVLKQKLLLPGFILIITGEVLRKSAMVTAKKSFTHKVRLDHHPTNELVVTGPYRLVRHPGYLGWMIWALGTQVLLCNPLCAVGFLFVSWRFFRRRIAIEEDLLHCFFGEKYASYAREVPCLIPFSK